MDGGGKCRQPSKAFGARVFCGYLRLIAAFKNIFFQKRLFEQKNNPAID